MIGALLNVLNLIPTMPERFEKEARTLSREDTEIALAGVTVKDTGCIEELFLQPNPLVKLQDGQAAWHTYEIYGMSKGKWNPLGRTNRLDQVQEAIVDEYFQLMFGDKYQRVGENYVARVGGE